MTPLRAHLAHTHTLSFLLFYNDIGVNVDDYISYLFSVHQKNNQSRGTYRAIIPCPQFLAVGTSWGGFQINHFNDLYHLRYWPCTLNQHYGLEVDSHLM